MQTAEGREEEVQDVPSDRGRRDAALPPGGTSRLQAKPPNTPKTQRRNGGVDGVLLLYVIAHDGDQFSSDQLMGRQSLFW